MSLTSTSPERVAREALAVAVTALPRYPHTFSPKLYTPPQRFACLVLKTFFTTAYRGIAPLLADLPELVRPLGLETVPHFTTLHKAARRRLRLPLVQRLLTVTIRRVRPCRRRVALAAMDSTGFACRHISADSVRRRSRERSLWQTTTYTRFSKLEAVVDCARHLVIGALPRRGPRVDVDRVVPLLNSALQRVRVGTILADAGYDSAPTHRHARERCGIRSVIPATAGRPPRHIADRPVPARDETTVNQDLLPLRATVAGRDGFLDAQAPVGLGRQRPLVLESVPRPATSGHHTPCDDPLS